jgi:hypothetical protein
LRLPLTLVTSLRRYNGTSAAPLGILSVFDGSVGVIPQREANYSQQVARPRSTPLTACPSLRVPHCMSLTACPSLHVPHCVSLTGCLPTGPSHSHTSTHECSVLVRPACTSHPRVSLTRPACTLASIPPVEIKPSRAAPQSPWVGPGGAISMSRFHSHRPTPSSAANRRAAPCEAQGAVPAQSGANPTMSAMQRAQRTGVCEP